jgi:hypothetical protein
MANTYFVENTTAGQHFPHVGVTPSLRFRRAQVLPSLPPPFFSLGLTLFSFTFLDVRCDVHKFPSPIFSQPLSLRVFSKEN